MLPEPKFATAMSMIGLPFEIFRVVEASPDDDGIGRRLADRVFGLEGEGQPVPSLLNNAIFVAGELE